MQNNLVAANITAIILPRFVGSDPKGLFRPDATVKLTASLLYKIFDATRPI